MTIETDLMGLYFLYYNLILRNVKKLFFVYSRYYYLR